MVQNRITPGLNHSVMGQNHWIDYARFFFQSQVKLFIQSFLQQFQQSAMFFYHVLLSELG